ncbi:MAG: hypothetical protein WA985_09865 [Erythrobacter sp.]
MSSNAVTLRSRMPCPRARLALTCSLALTSSALLGSPLLAQNEPDTPDAASPAAEMPDESVSQETAVPSRTVIDLTVTVPRDESDRLLEEDCVEANDAATVSNEIVICRRRGEGTDGSWNREEWERDYAARTQGSQPVDVAGAGIFRGPATVSGLCLIPPCPPEAALMIDVEALPEAPEGSDADRISRGLPALGEDEGPTPEEIAERRRALGLDAPPIPDE